MAIFELIDRPGAPAPPGPWQTRPAAPASFSARAGGEPAGPVWRIELPDDPAAAWAALRAAEAELGRHEAALDGAPARISALAAAGGAASFSTTGLPAPERQLLALLGGAGGAGGETAGSFSTRGAAPPSWAEAEERFRAFVAQVQEAVSNYAVVETRVGGGLVARSTVSWTGDMRSLLGAAPTAGQREAHRRAVGLALRSRAALLKSFGTVMRGATLVAVMAGSPAGALMAMPAAWRFVDQLVSDLRGK